MEYEMRRKNGNYNIINNYYKYGPSTNKNVRYRIVNPSKNETLPFGKWFVDGNVVDEARDVSKNNWLGIDMGNGGTEADKKTAVMEKAFPTEPMYTQDAAAAFTAVLEKAGASFRRDTLDQRIINDVKNRTGRLIDVQGGFPHGTAFEQTINAWPTLNSLPPAADRDQDGMPDEWETKNGLNPADPADASQVKLAKIYTNIEVYINSLTK